VGLPKVERLTEEGEVRWKRASWRIASCHLDGKRSVLDAGRGVEVGGVYYLHCCSLFWRHAGDGGVLEDPAVEVLHDVKGRADYAVVLAEDVCFGRRDISLLEGVEDAVFSVDSVCSSGQKLPGRFLAHDIAMTVLVCEEIGRIGLAVAELE